MSNKEAGTRFEKEFAEILAEHWFWVHLFQDNKNGQPCDVIAARDDRAYLFDCKNCEEPFFRLDRMEENQYNAMRLYDITGNRKGMFAIRFPSSEIYLVQYDRLKEMQEKQFKRIDKTVCRTQGTELKEWLGAFDEESGEKHEDHDWS